MIARLWHGWTTAENADAYEALIRDEIFVWIEGLQLSGYRGAQLLRRDLGDEVAFVKIMWFDTFEDMRGFAGEDVEAAVIPPKSRALLARFDARVQVYEVRASAKD